MVFGCWSLLDRMTVGRAANLFGDSSLCADGNRLLFGSWSGLVMFNRPARGCSSLGSPMEAKRCGSLLTKRRLFLTPSPGPGIHPMSASTRSNCAFSLSSACLAPWRRQQDSMVSSKATRTSLLSTSRRSHSKSAAFARMLLGVPSPLKPSRSIDAFKLQVAIGHWPFRINTIREQELAGSRNDGTQCLDRTDHFPWTAARSARGPP